jgi:oligo-1,6-glucosidase
MTDESNERPTSDAAGPDRTWWKEAVVYQIYPRSFNDSNGDGIGDIPGIVGKVDYLEELGVDVVWLCPVYDSPNADNGYDIADYRAIMDEFGEMADWEELLEELHDRDMRLVMDLVVNHTSDEHAWFTRSRESTGSDYREYYYWREGRPAAGGNAGGTNEDEPSGTEAEGENGPNGDGTSGTETNRDGEGSETPGPAGERPPNNWESLFGGSAWQYDERTEEWYLHLFDEKQADLNWENPDVRTEVFELMRWWLDKGIDGFRMDVINLVSKREGLPDGAEGSWARGAEHFVNGPKLEEYLSGMHERALAGYDAMTVGEMIGTSVGDARKYISTGAVDMVFHFEHMGLDHGDRWWDVGDWSLLELKEVFSRWQEGLYPEGWNALYLGNHDQPRVVSRFGDDAHREKSAKLLVTFLCTLRGTPFVYQGEEIGMTNVAFDSLSQYRDVATLTPIRTAIEEGIVEGFGEIRERVRKRSRDNARTPMQWNGTTNAGFTEGEPWIDLNSNYEEVNVEAARNDPDSVYHYYREVIALRKREDVLVYGEYDLLRPDHEAIYAYTRTLEPEPRSESEDESGADRDRSEGADAERALVVLNFSDGTPVFELPADVEYEGTEPLIANYEGIGANGADEVDEADGANEAGIDSFELRPWEARVYRLE